MTNRQHDQIQWIPTGDPATVDMTRNPYSGALGGLYTDNQGKQWQLVAGASDMSVPPFPGAVAWWDDKANFKVTTDPSRRGMYAGVIARLKKDGAELAYGPSKGNFFFIQKGGRAVVKTTDAVTAAPTNTGQYVVPSATAGKADVLAAGSAATYPPIGREAGWYNVAAREVYVDLDNSDRED
jgi:hypothetical protein